MMMISCVGAAKNESQVGATGSSGFQKRECIALSYFSRQVYSKVREDLQGHFAP